MWLFKNTLMPFFQNLVMLSPKIIEFSPKKILNFGTQKKEMGWVISTLALSKHSWMSSQMQWVSELTVPGQLSTIESRGTVGELVGMLQNRRAAASTVRGLGRCDLQTTPTRETD